MALTTLGLSAPEKPVKFPTLSAEGLYWGFAFAFTCATAIAPGANWIWWFCGGVFEVVAMGLNLPPLVGIFFIWPVTLTVLMRWAMWYFPRKYRLR